MHRNCHGYAAFKGPIVERRNVVLVSSTHGNAVAYALWKLEHRGALFVKPDMPDYRCMNVGEHTRPQEFDVNPLLLPRSTMSCRSRA